MKERAKPGRPDFVLCIPVVILLGFGMVMVFSASGVQSRELYNDDGVIFMKQMVALAVGLVGLLVTLFFPHRIYAKKPVMLLAIAAVLFLLIGVIFQAEAKGAHRWYYLGRFGFQPSDLAKVVLIVYIAAVSTAFGSNANPGVWRRRLILILPVVAAFCGLILAQPDFGTTMILLFITSVMLFLAGIPKRTLILGAVLLLPIMAGLLVSKSYRLKRLTDFMFSEHYQNRQAKLAVGSGGMTGLGLGQGKQKLYYLPEPHTDFIFATLCEELGLLGALTVLGCYLFFLFRGVLVLRRVPTPYSQILGSGLLLLLSVQALINISITLNLFPNKGLTLPFMSAGGTSLIISLCMFGILMNISREQVVGNRVAQ